MKEGGHSENRWLIMHKNSFDRICMVIHAGRVGSSVFASQFCGSSFIVAGEIHNVLVNGIKDWHKTFSYIHFFDLMLEQARNIGSPYSKLISCQDCRNYMFEFKPFHIGCGLDVNEAIDLFSRHGVNSFIFLHRKNCLRRYVSYLVSQSSGIWHTDNPHGAPYQINLDVHSCQDSEIGFESGGLIDMLDHYYNVFTKSVSEAVQRNNGIVINYEDHVESDPRIAYEIVCKYLDINEQIFPSEHGYKRQNPFKLAEIISNFNDVCNELINTVYYPLLLE